MHDKGDRVKCTDKRDRVKCNLKKTLTKGTDPLRRFRMTGSVFGKWMIIANCALRTVHCAYKGDRVKWNSYYKSALKLSDNVCAL